MPRVPVRAALVSIAALLMSCAGDRSPVSDPLPQDVRIANDENGPLRRIDVTVLDDGEETVLARPQGLAVLSDGSIAIGDASDLDIKIYDSSGRRISTIGRAGQGPGEFSSLRSISVRGDSLFGYDFGRPGATVFGPEGSFARIVTTQPAPFDSRVIDDSFMLQVAHPGQGRPLLAFADLNGRVMSEHLDPHWLDEHPGLRMHTAVFADASGGYVHAAIFGADQIYTLDSAGETLAIRRLPEMGSIVELWLAAGERAQHPDGSWFHDGLVSVMGMTALPGGAALVTVAEYDTRAGTDLVEGSRAILLPSVRQDEPAYALNLPGKVVGVAPNGDVVVLSYADYLAGTYQIERWRLDLR